MEVEGKAVGDVRAKMRCSIQACCSGENPGGGASTLLAVVSVVVAPEVAVAVALPPSGIAEALVHRGSGSSENGSGRVIDAAGTVNRGRLLAW